MKQVITSMALAMIAISATAQSNSGDTSRQNSNNNSNRSSSWNNQGWSDTSGMYRWRDTSYFSRNRMRFDSLVKQNRSMWNQGESYYVRGIGDTMRPYNQQQWAKDSINFERRNWDSFPSWQNENRWGDTTGFMSNSSNNNTGWNNGNSTPQNTMHNATADSGMAQGQYADTGRNSKGNPQSGSGGNSMSGTTGNTGTAGATTERKTTRTKTTNTTDENASPSDDDQSTSKTSGKEAKDRIFVKDNRVMISRKGVASPISKNITLKDGTVVMADGTVKFSNGTTRKMTNGEYISIDSNSIKTKTPGKKQ